MYAYIDPGTGAMLFTILIGVIGAARFALKSLWVKFRFIGSGGKSVESTDDTIPIVFFSEGGKYWPVYEPVIKELDLRGIDVVYLTASNDDSGLKNNYSHVTSEFIGSGNKAFARMNQIKADVVVSTTPGLGVYQWKRSRTAKYYIHMLHGPNEVTGYRMFGTDYYDALMLSGQYQVDDIRNLEKLRNLPSKDIELIGIPYMDEMLKRKATMPTTDSHTTTVLLAPTWGPSGILTKYGEKILDELLKTGYKIIIRPHPQSFVSEKELMDKLTKKYPESESLEWNRDVDNFEVLNKSDIMISDFSGVVFEFAFIFDKPLIYADTKFDNGPYDAWWLDTPFWTMTALPRIGEKLTEENISQLKPIIDECINNPKYKANRSEVKNETWVHPGEGAVRAADFIIAKYNKIKEEA